MSALDPIKRSILFNITPDIHSVLSSLLAKVFVNPTLFMRMLIMHRESVKYSIYIYSVGYADTSFFNCHALPSLAF